MKFRLPLIFALAALPGCEWLNQNLGWGPGRPGTRVIVDPDTWWGGDTGRDPEPFVTEPVISSISAECTPLNGGAELRARLDFAGWVDPPVLDIQATRTDDRRETFVFYPEANIAFCNDGSCDTWEHYMQQAEVYSSDAAEMTFDCTELADTNGLFTNAAFRVYASADEAAFDTQCAIWGHGSQDAFDDDCECFEQFLITPPADPCGEHPEAPEPAQE